MSQSCLRIAFVVSVLLCGFALPGRALEQPLNDGWEILRAARQDAPPAGDAAWVPFVTDQSRAYRAPQPAEPGLKVWLRLRFDTAAPLDEQLLLSIGNRMAIEQAVLNGRPLHDIELRQFQIPQTRETLAAKKADRYYEDEFGWERSSGPTENREEYYTLYFERWDVPAAFAVDPGTLQARDNELLLQVYDFKLHGELLGEVVLRSPTLADRVRPFAYSVPRGAFETETIVGVFRRLEQPGVVTARYVIEDYLGKPLDRGERTMSFDDQGEASFTLPAKSPGYKAKVVFEADGEQLDTYWAYLTPRLRTDGERAQFRLEGAMWQIREIEPGSAALPLPRDGWDPAVVPYSTNSSGLKNDILLRRQFALPEVMRRDDRVFLEIDQVSGAAEVFLNGRNLGTFEQETTPLSVDVTRVIDRTGENELVLHFRHKAGRPKISPVVLTSRPAVAIQRTEIHPSVQESRLTVRYVVENSTGAAQEVTVAGRVLDAGDDVLRLPDATATVPAGESVTLTVEQPWEDAQLWSPWSPKLYGLQQTLTTGGEVADAATERFGFREFTIDGHRILLNGQVFNGLGAEERNPNTLWTLLDLSHYANSRRIKRDLGFTFLRTHAVAKHARPYNDVADEVGQVVSVSMFGFSALGKKTSLSDADVQKYTAEGLRYVHRHFNHPSIGLWGFGNEIVCGNNRLDDDLAAKIDAVMQNIKAADPTRLMTADGSYDLLGRLETNNPHYTQNSWWLATPIDALPEQFTQRTDMQTGWDYSARRMGAASWSKDKPLYNSEYSWIQKFQPGEGRDVLGDAATKPTPTRHRPWASEQISALYAEILKRESDTVAFRHIEQALSSAFHHPYLTTRYFAPVAATLHEKHTRFWSGQTAERTVDVWNDSGDAGTFVVEVVLNDGTRTVARDRQTVTLDQGHRSAVPVALPLPKVSEPAEYDAVLTISEDGQERFRSSERWTVLPASWAQAPASATVAVYDPTRSVDGLLEQTGATVRRLTDLGDLASLEQGEAHLVVLGENAAANVSPAAARTLLDFVDGGGQVLLLRQDQPVDWLPFAFKPTDDYGWRAFVTAREHPVLTGTVPEDFQHWGPHGLVYGRSLAMPAAANVREILDGVLAEAVHGQGRILMTTLELTPTVSPHEPMVRKVLANIVTSASAATENTYARTLVLTPRASELGNRLREQLQIVGEYASNLPDELSGYDTIVLGGWTDAAPVPAAGPILRPWIEAGGRLVILQGNAAMAQWLSSHLGVPTEHREIGGTAAHRWGPDTLLAGISDTDMRWYRKNKRDPYTATGGRYTKWLLMTEALVPEGAEELTYPPLLTRLRIGDGALITNQARWDTVSPESDWYWWTNSQDLARRFMTAFFTNLDVPMGSAPGLAADMAAGPAIGEDTAEVTWAWTPVSVAPAANTEIGEAARGVDLAGLPTGVVQTRIAPFEVGPRAVALRGGGEAGSLPELSAAIPVSARADAIAVLHTATGAAPQAGEVLFEYELQYQGYSKVIPGEPIEPYLATSSVRTGIETGTTTDPLGLTPVAKQGPHVYVMTFANPKPGTPIESIVVRSRSRSAAPVVLGVSLGRKEAVTVPPVEPEAREQNLLPAGAFQGEGFPDGWTPEQNWMRSRFQVTEIDGQSAITATESPALMSAVADLPGDLEQVVLAFESRSADVTPGNSKWSVPAVSLAFVDAAGQDVGKGAWISLEANGPWQTVDRKLDVPAGAVKARVQVQFKAGSGQVWLANLRLLPGG